MQNERRGPPPPSGPPINRNQQQSSQQQKYYSSIPPQRDPPITNHPSGFSQNWQPYINQQHLQQPTQQNSQIFPAQRNWPATTNQTLQTNIGRHQLQQYHTNVLRYEVNLPQQNVIGNSPQIDDGLQIVDEE